ncbi:tripartite tricarboxylate transporter permease [Marinomonas gallaica]|uniref:tripartite tricarboxylate transporter permease n=1 Tax=Marinomonas gallaica TaxID=1806667 RepID=UPI0008370595|nr:tripartite tricarboxylate transporter permease [Marinomonas gallaica]
MSVLFSALDQVMSVMHLSYLMLGVVIGLIVGIIPGLGGIAGMSLLLPFIYGMDASVGLGMLMGLVAVVPTGDTFTSVLMGIPGSSSSQATVMDGFPLAKKGQAARALSAAFLSSMIGGVVGAVILSVFILVARPVVLAFSSAELFMLTLLGLSVVASLSGGSVYKGLAACGMGLLIGTIGGAPATGDFRFTFDVDYLYDGIPLIVVGLGIFALPEIISLLIKNKSIATKGNQLGQGLGQGLKDVMRNLPLVGRSSVFGSLVGAIPGLGGSVVDWMTYSFAMSASKDKSQFGKGEIKGVIAPESANNACSCGSMIPTILFGVPGSGSAAVFLGGMLLLGIQPGVSMVSTHLDLTYTIIWSLALANILGAALCIFLTRPISMLTYIKFSILAPVILTLILFAAYQATRSFGDFLALGAIALIGVLMKNADWPRPAFLIGFVLSAGAENYFFQSIQFYEYSWFTRPGVLIIGALILCGLFLPTVFRRMMRKRQTPEEAKAAADTAIVTNFSLDIWIAGLFLLVAVVFGYQVWGEQTLTSAFPLIAVTLLGGSSLMVIINHLRHRGQIATAEIRQGLFYIVGFFIMAFLYFELGFLTTTFVFSLSFIYFFARAGVVKSLSIAFGLLVFLLVLGRVMSVDYPEGLLDGYVLAIANLV